MASIAGDIDVAPVQYEASAEMIESVTLSQHIDRSSHGDCEEEQDRRNSCQFHHCNDLNSLKE